MRVRTRLCSIFSRCLSISRWQWLGRSLSLEPRAARPPPNVPQEAPSRFACSPFLPVQHTPVPSPRNGDAHARSANRFSYVMSPKNSDSTSDPRRGSHPLKNPDNVLLVSPSQVPTLSYLPTHIVTCYRSDTTFFRSLSIVIQAVVNVFIAVVVTIAVIVEHGRQTPLSDIFHCTSACKYITRMSEKKEGLSSKPTSSDGPSADQDKQMVAQANLTKRLSASCVFILWRSTPSFNVLPYPIAGDERSRRRTAATPTMMSHRSLHVRPSESSEVNQVRTISRNIMV